MRTISRVACVLVLALVILSCDTTQPLLLKEQGFELQVRATGTIVRVMDVYTGFEDNDNDGQPDGDTFLFCLWRPPRNDQGVILPGIATRGPTSVPWGYYLEVSRLPAGATDTELVVSEDAVTNPLSNLTEYDQTDSIFGPVPPLDPVTIEDPITNENRTFKFTNGTILTEAREEVMASTDNPLATLDPANYGTKGEGLCSDFYPGPAGIDRLSGATYPYSITLEKGDTILIGARRAVDGPQGLGVTNPPAPGLSATFKLDGVAVSVKGTQSSAQGPGEAFSFSYTTR
jgi:hypothetical protein